MISNASVKKKIQGAVDKAGMNEDEFVGFIGASTKDAPYFLDFLRRALPDGSTRGLPSSAAQAFDSWVRSVHARSAASGKKYAEQINDFIAGQVDMATAAPRASKAPMSTPKARGSRPRVSQPKAAAPRKSTPKAAAPRKSTPKAAASKWYVFPAELAAWSHELGRSRKRWNDAVERGADPVDATARRISATRDQHKLESIQEMIEEIPGPVDPRLMQFVQSKLTPKAAAPRKSTPKAAAPRKSTPKAAAPRKSTPKTTRKAAVKKPTARKSTQQAAAQVVVDQAVKTAVRRARSRGITGPMKISFNLIVEKI